MTTRRILLAAIPAVLAGCVLLELVAVPFRLLFSALESIGSGIESAVTSIVQAEPIEGPAPTVVRRDDGAWLVEAPAAPSRFRVTVSSPGHTARSYVWPDDFKGVRAGADGVARVDCLLARDVRATEPESGTR